MTFTFDINCNKNVCDTKYMDADTIHHTQIKMILVLHY